jgi:tetratricopeptide (TPR) repeat protein
MKAGWASLALLFLVAMPAAAQDGDGAIDFAAMTDAQLRERVAAIRTEGFSYACTTKVPLFKELRRRSPDSTPFDRGYAMSQAICAAQKGDDARAMRLLKQAEKEYGDLGLDLWAAFVAVRLEDGGEALARMKAMAASGQLFEVPAEEGFAVLRTIRAHGSMDQLDAFSYDLTRAPRFSQFEPNMQGAFASGALRHAVRLGDLSRAEEFLAYDPDPQGFLTMLADRRYEPAWPIIERLAGDNLATVSDAHVKASAEYLAEKPEDRDRLSTYAYALLYAGRFQEAVDVARSWRPERDNLDDLEEGDAWALNIEAYALDALGKPDEADVVFDRLATLPADEHSWVVNFVINRASRLVGQQRWEAGLEATVLARSVAENHGSTYAKLLIARDRACALQQLGRTDEIAPEVEFLVEHFNDAAAVAATGLLCVGERAKAEQLLDAALSEEVAAGGLIYDLQDRRFELFYTPSQLPQAREVVLANESLRAKALERIRLLPENLVPIAYLRRTELAAQRTP